MHAPVCPVSVDAISHHRRRHADPSVAQVVASTAAPGFQDAEGGTTHVPRDVRVLDDGLVEVDHWLVDQRKRPSVSVADIKVFVWIRHLRSGALDHVPTDLPDRSPTERDRARDNLLEQIRSDGVKGTTVCGDQ